ERQPPEGALRLGNDNRTLAGSRCGDGAVGEGGETMSSTTRGGLPRIPEAGRPYDSARPVGLA
ncbi:MAG: hypothetical protein QOF68_682, partial [Gaiellales bacterium]|nr:hypothetical protein [Gaiellales bacterium]